MNHLDKLANWARLAKWLSVRLQTKWLWVRVPLQSLNPKDFCHDLVQMFYKYLVIDGLLLFVFIVLFFVVYFLCNLTFFWNSLFHETHRGGCYGQILLTRKCFQKVHSFCGSFQNMKLKKKSFQFFILKDFCMLKLFSYICRYFDFVFY